MIILSVVFIAISDAFNHVMTSRTASGFDSGAGVPSIIAVEDVPRSTQTPAVVTVLTVNFTVVTSGDAVLTQKKPLIVQSPAGIAATPGTPGTVQ